MSTIESEVRAAAATTTSSKAKTRKKSKRAKKKNKQMDPAPVAGVSAEASIEHDDTKAEDEEQLPFDEEKTKKTDTKNEESEDEIPAAAVPQHAIPADLNIQEDTSSGPKSLFKKLLTRKHSVDLKDEQIPASAGPLKVAPATQPGEVPDAQKNPSGPNDPNEAYDNEKAKARARAEYHERLVEYNTAIKQKKVRKKVEQKTATQHSFGVDFESERVILAMFVGSFCFASYREDKEAMARDYLNIMSFLRKQGVNTWHKLCYITQKTIDEESYHFPVEQEKLLKYIANAVNYTQAHKVTSDLVNELSQARIEALQDINKIPPNILSDLVKDSPKEGENKSYIGRAFNSRTGQIIVNKDIFSLNGRISRISRKKHKSPKVDTFNSYSEQSSESSSTTEGELGVSVPAGPVPVSASVSASKTNAKRKTLTNSRDILKAVTSELSLEERMKDNKYTILTNNEIKNYNFTDKEKKELSFISYILRNIKERPIINYQYAFAKVRCAVEIFSWLLKKIICNLETGDVLNSINKIIEKQGNILFDNDSARYNSEENYNIVNKTEFEIFYLYLSAIENGDNLLKAFYKLREETMGKIDSFKDTIKSNDNINIQDVKKINIKLEQEINLILSILNTYMTNDLNNKRKIIIDKENLANPYYSDKLETLDEAHDFYSSICEKILEQLAVIKKSTEIIENSEQTRKSVFDLIKEYKDLMDMIYPNKVRAKILIWEQQIKKECFNIVRDLILENKNRDYYKLYRYLPDSDRRSRIKKYLNKLFINFKQTETCTFFELFGTHYVSKVEFGGLTTRDSYEKQLEQESSSKYSGSVGVYGQKVGGSRSQSKKDREKQAKLQESYVGNVTKGDNGFKVENSVAIENIMKSLWYLYEVESNSSAKHDHFDNLNNKLQRSAILYQWMKRTFLMVFHIEENRILFAYKNKDGELKWKSMASDKDYLQKLCSLKRVCGVSYSRRAFLFREPWNNTICTLKEYIKEVERGKTMVLVPNGGSLEKNCTIYLCRDADELDEGPANVIAPIPERKWKLLRKGLPKKMNYWNSKDDRKAVYNPEIPKNNLTLYHITNLVKNRVNNKYSKNSRLELDREDRFMPG